MGCSLCSSLGGIDHEKLYRATLSWGWWIGLVSPHLTAVRPQKSGRRSSILGIMSSSLRAYLHLSASYRLTLPLLWFQSIIPRLCSPSWTHRCVFSRGSRQVQMPLLYDWLQGSLALNVLSSSPIWSLIRCSLSSLYTDWNSALASCNCFRTPFISRM